MITGNLKDENIYFFKTSSISIKCNEPIELSIDGEYGGKNKEVLINVIQQYVEYLIPYNATSKAIKQKEIKKIGCEKNKC